MAKRTMALLLSLVFLVTLLAGCTSGSPSSSQSESPSVGPTVSPTENLSLTELYDIVSDSSELPDWEGDVLKLRLWYGHGTGTVVREKSSHDVFNAELKRVFGIEFDVDNSFDNGGVDLANKTALLAATNDWPDVGQNVTLTLEIVHEGLLYDLTDLLPIYAPHYYELLQRYSPQSFKNGFEGTGRQYTVNFIDNDMISMSRLYPDLDMNKYQYIKPLLELGYPMYVRDDILKLAYPNAKTQDEIESLYVQNGAFTRDEIYDVPITSKQDAVDFYYNIKKAIDDNKITEGNRPVSATWASNGTDNWTVFSLLTPTWQGTNNVFYYSNFNMKTQQIELAFKQDYFKENLQIFNNFVRDGVASEDSLIENNEIFMNKLNNGEYAITVEPQLPDESKLKAAGKPYRYRKVYMDIPQDTSTYINMAIGVDMTRSGFCIFKDKVREEDVPRILQYLDFLYTEPGMKLMVWGPRSAGLFTEENGVRKYTDPELEACMVYGVTNDADVKYNLASGYLDRHFPSSYPQVQVGIRQGGLQNPKYSSYDLSTLQREPGNANKFFTTGMYNPVKWGAQPVSRRAHLTQYQALPKVKDFIDVRITGFEPLIYRAMAARTDAEFEAAYNNMIQFAADYGIDDSICREIEKYLQEVLPDDWAAYLAGY